MLFFALLVVVVFSFSFDPNAEESRRIAGVLIWVAFLFAAVVALNQTWARELRNQVLDAYRVSPAPANSLFMAKALGNFVFVVVLEALMTPLFIMFYQLRALGPAWQLIPVAALGTWALVVNGTFFAAMSIRTRSREIMLPLLLFPFSIPALLAMVNATTAILTGELSARFWIVLLATYDVVFLSLVYFCLSRCCRRNETGVPNPGFPGGSFPGLCGVSSSGDCAHRADHGQRPAHLLLSCAFGMDGFPAVFHQFHCLGHLSDPAESIRRRNRVSLCRSWRCLLHRGFSHRPTVGAPGVGDLVDVGCAPHLNPCAVADLFELPHAAAIFDERADACACGSVGDFRRT